MFYERRYNMKEFNSQICTSVEQSKRLLELGLKPETADMVYHNTNSRCEIFRWKLKPYPPTLKSTTRFNVDKLNVFKHKNSNGEIMSGEEYFNTIWGKDIPAWSLHRLIEMCNKSHFKISLYNNEVSVDGDLFEVYDDAFDNLVSVIGRLIKIGHFNKEYLKQ